ncbi:SMP-30/gluconolactonase/LRE family protein [Streptomyces sp. NPDC001941]|uniref:SMP-30/gluconolactonase/LRE family protein n=1 Tax=Streptomyces sp. NPDC001941 TaxID=3154659 RepID=UPI003328A4E2
MRRRTVRSLAVLAALTALPLAGCGTTPAPGAAAPAAAPGHATIPAREVMRLTRVHPETGMTLLEGPVFDAHGDLVVVDVTAPPGGAKVMRVDLRTRSVRPLVTDGQGAYTSAQFSPHDGRLYLTDFAHGEIVSTDADGGDRRTFFTGEVDGARMSPDDLAFDREGRLYVSDSRGLYEEGAKGRVVRIGRDGRDATVLARGLEAPNGIAFASDWRGLWVSELTGNRIRYLLLDGKGAVASNHVGMRVDAGVAQSDSLAVDAEGNVYQALHGRPAMAVFNRYGDRLATVEVPAERARGLTSATNVAIRPGTRKAYLTVSGPAGGYLYSFEALGAGVRQSNGG